ncbi:hypothetical protein DFQ28_007420 [Apophysomyces sp. BC1034]|nr:hypothetical protein DFQ28_007420 [Apophysomyces sp. BC1034]
MGESVGHIGPSGLASLTLPLPVSQGRGYAPYLALTYSSSNGNSPFGLGWNLGGLAIQRRTSHGVPQYEATDVFIGPDGEVLVPERDDKTGDVLTTSVSQYGGKALNGDFTVTRYAPCVEGAFNRIERWQPQSGDADFWLIHGADGQLHCVGKSAQARIADPAAPDTRIAVWLIEESLSPAGEHIYYQYQNAQTAGVSDTGRDTQANRYLVAVCYGNVSACADLYLWSSDNAPAQQAWLFTLILDYGQRGVDARTPPPWHAAAGVSWPLRQDPFSHYSYGFELRTHFLCRQVLMFHHFSPELGADATLVSRLLLEYDDNAVVSRLVSAQHLAYEPDSHALQALPPLELDYTAWTPPPASPAWRAFEALPGLDHPPYQLVDLYAEGLPGILYRAGTDWRYNAPVRDASGADNADTVAYTGWQSLPLTPALQTQHATLMDINGDGRLEWLVTPPGGPFGYYTMHPDRTWSKFIPLTQLPLEYLHPQATLADLHGAGLPDLAMIGPKSVRLYLNRRVGFGRGQCVAQAGDINLPVRGRDQTELVAFSDVLGSGQSHLVSVRHDRLVCWPNLGDGRFGAPLTLSTDLPFDSATFDPRRVFLVDVDGSGAADLIYADSQRVLLFLNQSGNRLAEPIPFDWPPGVRYDDLSQINFADVSGQGTVSLVFSQLYSGPGQAPQHWRYDFASTKPYLLSAIDNNRGAQTRIAYRSSAQEWLDEKHAHPEAKSDLPFPVQVVSHVMHEDAITGNQLVQSYRYRQGVYDGRKREFRGFGYVESRDSLRDQAGVPGKAGFSPPRRIRSWYHTGRQEDETHLYGASYQGDDAPYQDRDAFDVKPTWLTRFDPEQQQDHSWSPTEPQAWWLYRALKGRLLRQEVYGLDQNSVEPVPYSVNVTRYQVRWQQEAPTNGKTAAPSGGAAAPVVLPLDLEHTTYRYQRIARDPVISQSVQLQYDAYAHPVWSVALHYPRRLQSTDANPYTGTALPSVSWLSTFDTQQSRLRLQEQRNTYIHQDRPQAWILGLPDQSRQNVLEYAADAVPAGGLNREKLTESDGLLAATQSRVLLGQTVNVYVSELPPIVKLLDHQETAVLDKASVQAYPQNVLTQQALEELLDQGGYQSGDYILSVSETADTGPLWVSQHSYTTYATADKFYRPVTQQSTKLTGITTYTYDSYSCGLIQTEDALKNQVRAQYDYRFLVPKQIIDINRNTHEAQFDALGRVVGSTFYGTELGEPNGESGGLKPVHVGFKPVSAAPVPAKLTVSQAIDDAVASKPQSLATISVYDASSWMGHLSLEALQPSLSADAADRIWQRLVARRLITPYGAVRSRGRQWAASEPGIEVEGLSDTQATSVRTALRNVTRLPAHSATLTADAYPGAAQPIHIALAYSDGFGRALQAATRVPPGPAWQRTATGELKMQNGSPVSASANPRWTVTGRVEYDNKGQPVRVYQPYFMDDWRYVADRAMRADGYADTHYYDALGREVKVVTAKGYERRNHYLPWFTIAEDENDTGVGAADPA